MSDAQRHRMSTLYVSHEEIDKWQIKKTKRDFREIRKMQNTAINLLFTRKQNNKT